MAKSGDSHRRHFVSKEIAYLILCAVMAVAIYFAWQYFGLSNSHLQNLSDPEKSESLNDH